MTARTTSTRTGLLAAGVVVLVVGVLVAAGLWYSAGQRYEDAVRNLARAPVGCVTTLDFAETGEYFLFVETRGSLDVVVGDCGAVGDFERGASTLPSLDVTLVDPRGDEVGLDPAGDVTYDVGGSTGQAVDGFRVETAGDHLLTVAAPADDFAVAVGRDPNDGVGAMRLGAALAAIAGLVIGGGLLVVATRRRPGPPADVPGWPGAGWVTTPPGMPTPPSPADWRPAAGPPTRPPEVPGQPPLSGRPPSPPTGPAGPPVTPPDRADSPPSRPMTTPGTGNTGDGNTGDGERSPWAAPDDRA